MLRQHAAGLELAEGASSDGERDPHGIRLTKADRKCGRDRTAKLLRSAPGNVRTLQSDLESARAQLGPVHPTTPPQASSPAP